MNKLPPKDDDPTPDKCLRTYAIRSRHGELWPVATYQRPDGSLYATIAFRDDTMVRWGYREDGPNRQARFIDPEGGPFIDKGYEVTVSSDPYLVGAVTSITFPDGGSEHYVLELGDPTPTAD